MDPVTDQPETVQDPVCDMPVVPESAAGVSEYQGRRYFFCGPRCLARFQAEPTKYASPIDAHDAAPARSRGAQARSTDTAALYTCPMHPEVQQSGPGACP